MEDKVRSPSILSHPRFTLNYKGIPYRTEWVEYDDIEKLCRKLGVQSPPGGFSLYTLPTIYDPTTDKAVTDSLQIALYLDKTYPDTPRVVPEGTETLQAAFQASWDKIAATAAVPLVLGGIYRRMSPVSSESFRAKTEGAFGCKIEDFDSVERRKGMFGPLKDSLDIIRGWYELNGNGGAVMGGTISFADIGIGAWFRAIESLENDVYPQITAWDDGFWAKKVGLLEQYSHIV